MKSGLILTPRFGKPAALAGASYVVPATIDLRSQLLPSSDQGSTSQCVAYAMAGWIEFYRWKMLGIAEQVDPRPIYHLAKQIDGIAGEGTTLEAGVEAAARLGWIKPENVRNVSNLAEVQQALHRHGCILAGFDIDDGWFNAAADGWIKQGAKAFGGHAVLLCGYHVGENYVAFQNSWGEGRGWRGFNRVTNDRFSEQFQYGLVWED